MRAIALYDFDGILDHGEISFKTGDWITVVDDTSDDGWWVGRTMDGHEGAFPKLYVDVLDTTLDNALTKHQMGASAIPQRFLTSDRIAKRLTMEFDADTFSGSPEQRFRSVTMAAAMPSPPPNRVASPPPITFDKPDVAATSGQLSPTPEVIEPETTDSECNTSPPRLAIPPPPPVPPIPNSVLPAPHGSKPATPVSMSLEVREVSPLSSYPNSKQGGIASSVLFGEYDTASISPSMAASQHGTLRSQAGVGSSAHQNPGTPSKMPRRNLNRFSEFVQSGAEDFLLRKEDTAGSDSIHFLSTEGEIGNGRPKITDEDGEAHWIDVGPVVDPGEEGIVRPEFDMLITGHVKRTKYGGVKSFISYQVYNRSVNCVVYRRYKHFEWLHSQLGIHFGLLCIPPLPEKQAQGRFTPDFIACRKRALERFLKRVARHPVLRQAPAFRHFVSCTDDRMWKVGKRRAELEGSLMAGALRSLSSTPTGTTRRAQQPVVRNRRKGGDVLLRSLEVTGCDSLVQEREGNEERESEWMVNQLEKFLNDFDKTSLGVCDASQAFLYAAPTFKSVFAKMSVALSRMTRGSDHKNKDTWCWKDKCTSCHRLTRSIDATAHTLGDIANFWETNASAVCIPILEELKEYEELSRSVRSIMDVHRDAVAKLNDTQKMAQIHETDSETFDMLQTRSKAILALTVAELDQFHKDRLEDMKRLMTGFLDGQISFHMRMVERLQAARNYYDFDQQQQQ